MKMWRMKKLWRQDVEHSLVGIKYNKVLKNENEWMELMLQNCVHKKKNIEWWMVTISCAFVFSIEFILWILSSYTYFYFLIIQSSMPLFEKDMLLFWTTSIG
jgi:hypothetical protein